MIDVWQGVALAAAVAILAAFAAVQLWGLARTSIVYVLLNVGGATALTAVAVAGRQWGFLLLWSCWTVVSLWSLRAWLQRRRQRSR